ncbi:hypothetical protein ACFL1G_03900 [Planctomycetota bacterium]
MRGWRTKLVFLLVVYFAGFATAVYFLAPVPQGQDGEFAEDSLLHSAFKSDEFAKSFNSGMHKCIDFSKDAAMRAGEFIKQKLDSDLQDDS